MRILLLSDSGLNVNRGGFPQTLYNIFSFVNPKDFLFITSLESYKIAPTSSPFISRTLTYNIKMIPVQKNRLGKYVNKFIGWFNYSFSENFRRFSRLQSAVKKFDPEVVVAAPNGTEGVFMYHKLKAVLQASKVFPYFMDDWLYQTDLKWVGGTIQGLAKWMLTENNTWMMISENLAEILSKRYRIKPARVLEIHNPVDLAGIELPLAIQNKQEYTIAYAGALWPMHFDAFLVMANAVKLLQEKKIKLILYTAESNWLWRKDELTGLDIIYGGFVPYKNIHSKLAEADCLLVTSSFSSEWKTHSTGSIQTKITDYMKAARLIISCGPSYAANNVFLKKYNCGICIETNDIDKAAVALNAILNDMPANVQYATNGTEVLRNNFSFEKVHQRLKDFLAA